jgi:hypothetical protein
MHRRPGDGGSHRAEGTVGSVPACRKKTLRVRTTRREHLR